MPGPRKNADHDHSEVFVVVSGGDPGVVDSVSKDRIQLGEESDVDILCFIEVHAPLVTLCDCVVKVILKKVGV